METPQKISIILAVLDNGSDLDALIRNLKNSLAYVSYRLNQPLQFEFVIMTNNSRNISEEQRNQIQKNSPVIFCDENEKASKSYLFKKGMAYAKYKIRVYLPADYVVHPETFGEMIITVTKGTDVGILLFDKKDKRYESAVISNATLRMIQKNSAPKALVITEEVWETLKRSTYLEETYFIEFIRNAREAGFAIALANDATNNQKKRSFLSSLKQKVKSALLVSLISLNKVKPLHTPSTDSRSMINAGVRYNRKKFVTHTTLPFKDSAIDSFTTSQIFLFLLFLDFVFIGIQFNAILLLQIIFACLSIFYLLDVLFNFFLVFKTVRGSSELSFTQNELDALNPQSLPMYTILCPLYKEAHMLGHFLDGIAKIDWPADKLDVLLLLEEDDKESIETIQKMELPSYVRTLVVPTSQPKTKPKACNYGLAFAKGEYVVIFDAEDIPDPLQLKKAYLGFQRSDRNIVCLQAKLNYHNAKQNLLTRFFTAEYSWLFDISLPGLQTMNTIIPLGGTSNHFRKADLIALKGWDPFNVTEDADLGIRIFRLGYRTAIIDSVTLEEANSNVFNWIRQRSRWVKGYMQTYLVHTRDMGSFIKQRGLQSLMLHFVIGGRILFIFVNPLLWIITLSYFMFKDIVGPFIESTYSPIILYTAVISLVFGNYLYILGYVLGCVKRKQWGLIKYVFILPLYLLLISVAGCVAFYQLLFKPHYWEKTVHGLHLVNNTNKPKSHSKLPKLFSFINLHPSSLVKKPANI